MADDFPLLYRSLRNRTLPLSTSGAAPVAVEKKMPKMVYATGIGYAPDDVSNPLNRRDMARSAAQIVAYANLLVNTKAEIEAAITVNNGVARSRVIEAKSRGVVTEATVVSERELPDGGYEIKLQVPLENLKLFGAE